MRNKGFIYTLVTVVMLLMIIFLSGFYFRISKPKMDDTITNIQTDELHYFVESLKTDFDRAARITAQRAVLYLSGYIMDNDLGGFDAVRDYQMSLPSCSDIIYKPDGVQAALAELMLCNTLFGIGDDAAANMEYNTLFNWTANMTVFAEESNYVPVLRLINLTIRPFGPYNIVVIGEVEAYLRDTNNLSFFVGNISTASIVPLEGFSDPFYDVLTGRPELLLDRDFIPCNGSGIITTQRIDEWINGSCYFNSSFVGGGPTFFDRMEGNLFYTTKYYLQAAEMATETGFDEILGSGLESFVDLGKFEERGVSVDRDSSWVDYLYWQDYTAECWMEDMPSYHQNFRIDRNHAVKYRLQGVFCGGVKICDKIYLCGMTDDVNPEDFGVTCELDYSPNPDPDIRQAKTCDATLVPFSCDTCPMIPETTDCCVDGWNSENLWIIGTPVTTSTTTTVPTCIESDSGMDYYVYGETTGILYGTSDPYSMFYDCCVSPPSGACLPSGSHVKEWYCRLDHYVDEMWYLCPAGCVAGACS